MTLQSKYNALAKSKLGRIQLKYWKIKKINKQSFTST